MKTIKFPLVTAIFILAIMLTSCTKSNQYDESVGFNGSFEFIKQGMPVNWTVNLEPINNRKAKLKIDHSDPQDGENAIRLIIKNIPEKASSSELPALWNKTEVKPGTDYILSIWLKNEKSEFKVKWSTKPKDSEEVIQSNIFVETNSSFTTWYYFKEDISLEENEEVIQIDIEVSKPGEVWIDDIKIEKAIE